ncbi:tandem-95 repeat protein [Paraglaciecola aquimarina]|uniref:Tandem-95 repeat protein n=1 Tax=Paraglaciecola aquimarina TaxID=1235557 RepID=A0ABU3SX38_9ALTE|nr:tandem-95 repeat protein [Paraglaciecola aquimarina]MDU0354576.1 tandem-95 repeat protein [Paraglaciecola aquimarina]
MKAYLLGLPVLIIVTFMSSCGGGSADPEGDSPQTTNNLPTAKIQSLEIDQDKTLSVILSGSDLDGTISQYTITQQPTHGELIGSGANWQYSPTDNFYGNDSFSFTVTDNDGGVSKSAKISISVIELPKVPNLVPQAISQSFEMSQVDSLSINLSGSDLNGMITGYQITQQPSNGMLTGSGAQWSYQAKQGFIGRDSFRFTVTDEEGAVSEEASVNIQVNQIRGQYIYVATTGDDSNAGHSDSPLQTINTAVKKASSGDVILINEGIYREEVLIENKHDITIKANGSQLVTISGADIIQGTWTAVDNMP